MSQPTIKDIVKDTTAKFSCYRDGDLWYKVVKTVPVGEVLLEGWAEVEIFEFPIPISDTGTGIFPAELKAITLMRWVRKHLEKKLKGEA